MKNIVMLLIFWSLWYLAFSTRTLVAPLLPLIKGELSLSHTMAGSLYLYAGIGATLASLSSGYIALIIGVKRLIALSFLMIACASIGIFYADSYIVLAALLFIFGLSGNFYLPCAIPLITTIFDPANWGKAISVHETAAGFSILTLPLLIAFSLHFIEWRFVFVIYAAVIALPLVVFWILSPDPQPDRVKTASLNSIFKRADFWIVLILWVNCGMTSMGVYNIVPLFLVDEKGMDINFANKVFGISRIGGFVGQIFMGFFLDRFSTRKIIFFLVLASGISTFGLAMVDSQWLFIIILLLQATFSVVFFPVGIMAISKLTDLTERSIYTGTIMAISGMVALGVTPLVLGIIADAWSYQVGLALLGVFTLGLCPIVNYLKQI